MPSTSALFDHSGDHAAILFDGKTAERWSVLVRASGDALQLSAYGTVAADLINANDLQFVKSDRLALVLTHVSKPGWRLSIAKPLSLDLETLLIPHQQWRERLRLAMPSRHWLIMATATTTALIFVGFHIVDWLVPLIPDSLARSVGDDIITQVTETDKLCTGTAGRAALERLADRLKPATLPYVRVDVASSPVVNAFAVPGDHIVVFMGLLDVTPNADALAGVLAHEMGHLEHKHPLRSMAWSMTIGTVINAIGGNVGGIANVANLLANSRSYEHQADQAALDTLVRNHVATKPMADLFNAMEGIQDKKAAADKSAIALPERARTVFSYMQSHPATPERTAMFAAVHQTGTVPSVPAADWFAIQSICDRDKKRPATAG